MSRRALHYTASSLPTTGTRYWDLIGGRNQIGTTITANSCVVMCAGVLENLVIGVDVAFGVGNGYTWTVMVNGVDTAMTVTISGAADVTARYTATSIALAVGDRVVLKSVSIGTPTTSIDWRYTVEFNSTTANETLYGGTFGDGASGDGGLEYLNPLAVSLASATVTTGRCYIAAPGSFTAIGMMQGFAATAPVGSGYIVCMYLNGVKQDGGGGTVDTEWNFFNWSQNTPQSHTFTLPVVRGDYVEIRLETELAGGALGVEQLSIGVRFVADDDDEFPMAQYSPGAVGTTTTFRPLQSIDTSAAAWTAVDTYDTKNIAPISGMTVHGLLFRVTTAPAAGKDRVFAIQQNGSTVADSPTCTIADAAVVAEDITHTLELVDNDTFRLHHTPSGTPTGSGVTYYSWVQGGQAVDPAAGRSYGFIL